MHSLEDAPFSEAAERGLAIFGAQPYFSESRYRDELRRARISSNRSRRCLRDDLSDSAASEVVLGRNRFDLQMAMLLSPIRTGPAAELSWLVAETDALRTFRDEVTTSTAAGMVDATKRMVMRDYRNPRCAQR